MPGHPDETTRLDELLRRRSELDRRLAAYKKEFAVMFADIAGSTSFFERRGDLSGIAMVQELVDRARAVVEPLGGRLVKSLGDAVLVEFPDPEAAVRGALALQEGFVEVNRRRAAADRLQLRIGLSWGSGFVKEEDVFGDVVNLAARLEQVARPGQIIVSAALYGPARRVEGIELRRLQDAELKGKSAPQEIYEVIRPGATPAPTPAAAVVYSLGVLSPPESAGAEFPLSPGPAVLGRDLGDIRLRDSLLSSPHARFVLGPEGLQVEDLGPSGVFLRLRQPVELQPDDEVLFGRKVCRFESGASGAALHSSGQRHALRAGENLLGRREGDIVFRDDAFLSGLHARLCVAEGAVVLEDLHSTNGTFLKVRGKAPLADGDQLLCGKTLLVVRARPA